MRLLKPIVETIQASKNTEELENFLIGIFTPVEIEQLAIRYKIIQMLKEGIPQHKIAQQLGVGVATVTRGSKMLKKGMFKNVN